jgi:L-malate glycosyltransferase
MKNSVLFLTNTYPDFDSSYRGVFIKTMAALLQGEGHRVTVVTPKIYKKSRYIEDQDGIGVYRFPFFSGNRLLIEYKKIPYFRMLLYFITGFVLSIYAATRYKCQVIHAHWAIPTGMLGVLTSGLLRKPLIVTIHGSDFRMGMGKSSLLKKLFFFVCKRAAHLNCVSETMKKEIEQIGIQGERITVIPMGVDEDFLRAGGARDRNLNMRSFTILSNRNLQPLYNVSLLVRAIPVVLREEPGTRFLIAGDGPEKDGLARQVRDLKLEQAVQFLGRVPHEKMPELLTMADIFVSTSPHDGTSVSLLEAMACGTFPIVADTLSNREWISNGKNGFLVPEDETVLGKKIVEAIRNSTFSMGAIDKNREIVEKRAHWKTNVKVIEKIYEKSLQVV